MRYPTCITNKTKLKETKPIDIYSYKLKTYKFS